jgi:alkyl hydroperoxide reductase subunit AhpC
MGKSYGVYSEEKGFTVRSTVIIDKDGIVRYSQAVEPGGRRNALELAEICKKVL